MRNDGICLASNTAPDLGQSCALTSCHVHALSSGQDCKCGYDPQWPKMFSTRYLYNYLSVLSVLGWSGVFLYIRKRFIFFPPSLYIWSMKERVESMFSAIPDPPLATCSSFDFDELCAVWNQPNSKQRKNNNLTLIQTPQTGVEAAGVTTVIGTRRHDRFKLQPRQEIFRSSESYEI